jgi:chromosome segregation ATPase
MSSSQDETNELKALQQEVAELRGERKGRRSKATSKAEEASQESKTKRRRSKATSDADQEVQTVEEQSVTEPQASAIEEQRSEEEQVPELDKTIQDLVTHIESVTKGLQEATRENPALGLMAAFTTGIVVGYLLSRR